MTVDELVVGVEKRMVKKRIVRCIPSLVPQKAQSIIKPEPHVRNDLSRP